MLEAGCFLKNRPAHARLVSHFLLELHPCELKISRTASTIAFTQAKIDWKSQL